MDYLKNNLVDFLKSFLKDSKIDIKTIIEKQLANDDPENLMALIKGTIGKISETINVKIESFSGEISENIKAILNFIKETIEEIKQLIITKGEEFNLSAMLEVIWEKIKNKLSFVPKKRIKQIVLINNKRIKSGSPI